MALYEVLAARGEAEAGAAAHVVSLLEAGSGPQRETIALVLLHIRWQQCIIAPRELKYRRMKLHFEHSVVQVRGNWGYGGASRGAQRPRCSPRRPHPLGEAEAYNRRAPSEHHAFVGYFGRGSLRPRARNCDLHCLGGSRVVKCTSYAYSYHCFPKPSRGSFDTLRFSDATRGSLPTPRIVSDDISTPLFIVSQLHVIFFCIGRLKRKKSRLPASLVKVDDGITRTKPV